MRKIVTVHTICIFLFVLVLSSFQLAAQDKSAQKAIDSLNVLLKNEQDDTDKVKNLNQLSYVFSDKDYNKALEYAVRARALAIKLDYKKGIAISYRRSGYAYGQMNNYNRAIIDLQLALPILKEIHDEKSIAATYDDIVINYLPQGLYAAAIGAEMEALRLFEIMGDKEASANALQSIGAFYSLGGNDSDALKNLQYALQIRQEIKDTSGMAQSFATIGYVYTSSGDFIKALEEDSAAFRLYLELGVRAPDWGISLCRITLGDNYEKLGEKQMDEGNEFNATENFRKALENYLPALKFWIKTNNTYNIPGSYNKVGFAEMGLHRVREARDYFTKGLQNASMISLKEDLKDSYHGLSMVDSLEGNYRQAYEHYQKYIIYRDSLINEKSTKKMTQASMQYEFDKKEALQKAEQEKKDIEAKKEKNIQYFAIGALGLVVLAVAAIAFIQYRSNAHKKKANYLLQQQKEKVESTLAELKSAQAQLIQSEKMASLGELTAGIAHEIQNPLNFVNNFSEVSNELIGEMVEEVDKGNSTEVKAIANDIRQNLEKINYHGKRADTIVKGMLQHSRTTTGVKEPTDINTLADEYLRLAYHGLRARDNLFNATMKTDFDESLGKINIIPQDIGKVLMNLYNNAFYTISEKKKQKPDGFEPTVSISTKKIGDKVELRVNDNGKGIPQKVVDKIFQPFFTTKPTGQGTGLGLSLSYDIVKAHGGEIKVVTREGEGSDFVIHLPISV